MYNTSPLGINTLGELVDLQAGLGHVRILQEVHRHPDQMTLDLVQLLADVHRILHAVEDVACLDALRRQELVVVVESFDCELLVTSSLVVGIWV